MNIYKHPKITILTCEHIPAHLNILQSNLSAWQVLDWLPELQKSPAKEKKNTYNQIPHKNTEITDTKNMSHLLIIAHRFLIKWSTQAW
jgi:hypothetical protein